MTHPLEYDPDLIAARESMQVKSCWMCNDTRRVRRKEVHHGGGKIDKATGRPKPLYAHGDGPAFENAAEVDCPECVTAAAQIIAAVVPVMPE